MAAAKALQWIEQRRQFHPIHSVKHTSPAPFMPESSPTQSGGDGRSVTVQTLGCKVNLFESEYIYDQLRAQNWSRSPDAQADLCIINTCTVTSEADRQSRQTIRRMIRQNPNSTIVVTGCYAQMHPDRCAEIPGVDLVVPGSNKLKIPDYIADIDAGSDFAGRVGATDAHVLPEKSVTAFATRSRAFVQIQQGCDNGCTFCIIHKARGASRSLLPTMVNQQVKMHVENGFREIVLCGIDLGAYGDDLSAKANNPIDLAELTAQLAARHPLTRFRLSSIDPSHISPRLTDVISDYENVCPHIHLSLQSASPLILKRMKRRYSKDDVYRVVSALRNACPDLILSADVMAGFPTESDADFELTLNAVRDLQIAYAHVFAYSPRDGTPAAIIPKQVEHKVRKQRSKILLETADKVRHQVLRNFTGAKYRALVEHNADHCNFTKARLDNYIPIYIKGNADVSRDFIEVETQEHHLDGLSARLVTTSNV